MRKPHAARRTILILFALWLVLIFAWGLFSLHMADEIAKVKMKAFLLLNAGKLDQMGEKALAEDERGYASFFSDVVGPETDIELLYLPDDEYAPPAEPGWRLVSSAENAWRWENGNMFENGYIEVERLRPKWFCVETYYPT